MPKENTSPSASFRRNLYWTDGMEKQTIEVARRLKKAGVDGLFNAKGEVNRSAVLRYLLDKELKG